VKFGYLIAASLLVASAPTHAAEPVAQSPEMDMRCYLAARTAGALPIDPRAAVITDMLGRFYLGRMSGQLSDTEIKALASTQNAALKAKDFPDLIEPCATFLYERDANVADDTLQGLDKDASDAKPETKPAPRTPELDMRCHMFARHLITTATDPLSKLAAAEWLSFYLGRASSQLSDAELATVSGSEAKTAGIWGTPGLIEQCKDYADRRSVEVAELINQGKKQDAASATGSEE